MDVTRTALTFLALVATLLFLGIFVFDFRSWPLPVVLAVAGGAAALAAWLLDKVEVRSAIAARERRYRREQNAAAHTERLRREGIE